ncbi:MAG: regulatory iron-sulfur-containing complex subunit RicT, partial [Bacteroidota bacterium]
MACAGCSVNLKDGQPVGCRNNGNCSTGGCNRLNTFDWLSPLDIEDVEPFHVVEISFKNGARKHFFYNQPYTRTHTGDMVVVETQAGFDVGRITLSGELVRLQMRKKRVKEDAYLPKVIRKANERDLEKHNEMRELEKPTMIRARAIARTLDLNMKIGDIEIQADGKKATFFYTADGRVDFRELIRHFAKEFKIKIEMRQIGARQESGRLGGLGPCGRELCCSTWLTSYKTVGTAAARYQNLAINQAKLSGQCGRLKCCLNYELDMYMEALSSFPDDAEKLKTKLGIVVLVKTDIFKGLMYYAYDRGPEKGRIFALSLDQVRNVRAMNVQGEFPPDLASLVHVATAAAVSEEPDYEDVTGAIELPEEKRKKKKKKKNNRDRDEFRSKEGRPAEGRSEAQTQPGNGAPFTEKREGGRDKPKGGFDKNRDRKDRPQQPKQPKPQQPKSQQQPPPPGEKMEGADPNANRNRGEGKDKRSGKNWGRDSGKNRNDR